jgi:hypothetical protein
MTKAKRRPKMDGKLAALWRHSSGGRRKVDRKVRSTLQAATITAYRNNRLCRPWRKIDGEREIGSFDAD